MENETEKYVCINCGYEVRNLFRKYSPTVLKLTNCENCHKTADKYVEYDIIILIIDLLLLQQKAYRHILFNTEYKNIWKLSVIILLVGTYTEFTLRRPYTRKHFASKKVDVEFEYYNLEFYKIGIETASRAFSFVLMVYIHTKLYCKFTPTSPGISFTNVWHTMAISTFGILLLLPMLMWDVGDYKELHITFILTYIVLSQLIAYKVLCNCTKIWSVYVILISYYCLTFRFEYLYEFVSYNVVNRKVQFINVFE